MSSVPLLAGIGNRMRGDDCAGLLVADRVREIAAGSIEVRDLEGEPVDLVEALGCSEVVVVADATSRGVEPGTVLRLDVTEAPLDPGISPPSTHALGLAEPIELARGLGRLPASLVVWGIEGRDFAPGAPVSEEVARAAEQVARALVEELAP